MREFELISALRERLAPRRDDTRIGIGDDAAVLRPRAGHELVMTTDTLISGRHFPDDTPARDIGYKALAVNASDVAAMGGELAWVTVSLAAPRLSSAWCDAFVAGLREGCAAVPLDQPVDIVGGDTTRAPVLAVSITALGQVPAGAAVRRDGARAGEAIVVTGTLGDAAAGLACWPRRAGTDAGKAWLIRRLARPDLRRGPALRGLASAAIDVSDGLLADLGHVLAASGIGARLDIDRLPSSEALAAYAPEPERRRQLQATGGDDYELCLTVAHARIDALRAALGCRLTVIGETRAHGPLVCVDASGEVVDAARLGAAGWDHFDEDGEDSA